MISHITTLESWLMIEICSINNFLLLSKCDRRILFGFFLTEKYVKSVRIMHTHQLSSIFNSSGSFSMIYDLSVAIWQQNRISSCLVISQFHLCKKGELDFVQSCKNRMITKSSKYKMKIVFIFKKIAKCFKILPFFRRMSCC